MGLIEYYGQRHIRRYLKNMKSLLETLEIRNHDQYMGFNMFSGSDVNQNGYKSYTYRTWEEKFLEVFEAIAGEAQVAEKEIENLKILGHNQAKLDEFANTLRVIKDLVKSYAKKPKDYFKVLAEKDPHFEEYKQRAGMQNNMMKAIKDL